MANRNPASEEIFGPHGILCEDEAATRACARLLAEHIFEAAVLSLEGPLGAGKTCFVQGLAEGLGLEAGVVSSPTFTLVHEYPAGRLPLIHFDLYRLESSEELVGLGFEEYFEGTGIRAIEWGDKFPQALPRETWRLQFSIESGARRIRGTR